MNNKIKHTTIIIAAALALMLVGCGKPGSAGVKECTPAAKAMMASLGKTTRDTRLVYYFDIPGGREYTVVECENGLIKNEWKYCFFSPKYDSSFKTAMEMLKLESADKDEAALWYRTKYKIPSKLTWQKYYDGLKTIKPSPSSNNPGPPAPPLKNK